VIKIDSTYKKLFVLAANDYITKNQLVAAGNVISSKLSATLDKNLNELAQRNKIVYRSGVWSRRSGAKIYVERHKPVVDMSTLFHEVAHYATSNQLFWANAGILEEVPSITAEILVDDYLNGLGIQNPDSSACAERIYELVSATTLSFKRVISALRKYYDNRDKFYKSFDILEPEFIADFSNIKYFIGSVCAYNLADQIKSKADFDEVFTVLLEDKTVKTASQKLSTLSITPESLNTAFKNTVFDRRAELFPR
jgi:hypothetical protein